MPEDTRRNVQKMWMSVVVVIGLTIVGVIVIAKIAQDYDPQYEAPPTDDRRVIDAGSLEQCPLLTSRVGQEIDVLRHPGRGEMVVTTLADGVELDVVSVRVDFVQIRGPEGWVERRYTRRACPE